MIHGKTHRNTESHTQGDTESSHIHRADAHREADTRHTYTHKHTHTEAQMYRQTYKYKQANLNMGHTHTTSNRVLVITHPSTHQTAGTQSHTSRVMQIQMHTHSNNTHRDIQPEAYTCTHCTADPTTPTHRGTQTHISATTGIHI